MTRESEQRARDEALMARALELAKRGEGWTSPNPLVGAAIVKDGRIIGEGWHTAYGQPMQNGKRWPPASRILPAAPFTSPWNRVAIGAKRLPAPAAFWKRASPASSWEPSTPTPWWRAAGAPSCARPD